MRQVRFTTSNKLRLVVIYTSNHIPHSMTLLCDVLYCAMDSSIIKKTWRPKLTFSEKSAQHGDGCNNVRIDIEWLKDF